MKTWWDGAFSTEFREFVEAARQSHDLDIKITDEKDGAGPPSKRRRVQTGGTSQPVNPVETPPQQDEIQEFDISEIPALCYEARVTAAPKLVLKVTIGHGVFLENQGDADESIKAGVVLCGFYKGKFWSPDSTSEEPSEKSDVLFRLKSHNDG